MRPLGQCCSCASVLLGCDAAARRMTEMTSTLPRRSRARTKVFVLTPLGSAVFLLFVRRHSDRLPVLEGDVFVVNEHLDSRMHQALRSGGCWARSGDENLPSAVTVKLGGGRSPVTLLSAYEVAYTPGGCGLPHCCARGVRPTSGCFVGSRGTESLSRAWPRNR